MAQLQKSGAANSGGKMKNNHYHYLQLTGDGRVGVCQQRAGAGGAGRRAHVVHLLWADGGPGVYRGHGLDLLQVRADDIVLHLQHHDQHRCID